MEDMCRAYSSSHEHRCCQSYCDDRDDTDVHDVCYSEFAYYTVVMIKITGGAAKSLGTGQKAVAKIVGNNNSNRGFVIKNYRNDKSIVARIF